MDPDRRYCHEGYLDSFDPEPTAQRVHHTSDCWICHSVIIRRNSRNDVDAR